MRLRSETLDETEIPPPLSRFEALETRAEPSLDSADTAPSPFPPARHAQLFKPIHAIASVFDQALTGWHVAPKAAL